MTRRTPKAFGGGRLRLIGIDGDDTLWHGEHRFAAAEKRFHALVDGFAGPEAASARLLEIETRNLPRYGYGVKSFTLSMIEAAIELTGGGIQATDIDELIRSGHAILDSPVELIDGAAAAVAELAAAGLELVLITKGDLLDQESKVGRSGLAARFSGVEIVSEKDEATYRRVLGRHGVAPDEFLMAGNSIRSDVTPVLAVGGFAVHIPYTVTWAHEHGAGPAAGRGRFLELRSLTQLPDLLFGRAVAAPPP